MEKSRAIELLEHLAWDRDIERNPYGDALNMAIEALKAQLSKEGTTSDMISRTETVEHLRRVLDATVPITDYDEGYVDGVEFGISTVSTMPTIQPQSTTGQLNDGAQSTARSTDLIDRQQAIDIVVFECGKWTGLAKEISKQLKQLPPAQPEPCGDKSYALWKESYEELKRRMDELTACSDTISRQATIDAVNNAFDRETLLNRFVRSIAVRAIRDMPTVQPEPQWIPVERELPEDFTDVLVWFEYFRYGDYNCLYQTHGIGTYVANYNLWTVNHETGWKDLRVIAWMPLPTPYKPNNK